MTVTYQFLHWVFLIESLQSIEQGPEYHLFTPQFCHLGRVDCDIRYSATEKKRKTKVITIFVSET